MKTKDGAGWSFMGCSCFQQHLRSTQAGASPPPPPQSSKPEPSACGRVEASTTKELQHLEQRHGAALQLRAWLQDPPPRPERYAGVKSGEGHNSSPGDSCVQRREEGRNKASDFPSVGWFLGKKQTRRPTLPPKGENRKSVEFSRCSFFLHDILNMDVF